MIKYTKEKFQQLKAAYLQHIEKTCEDPSAFITDKMRRFGPVSPSTKTFVTLMLLDQKDREILAELCIYLHYNESGRNIVVETPKGYAGENSECRARTIIKEIQQRADAFDEYHRKVVEGKNKKLRKKINKQENAAAVIRKAIRTLENEIKVLNDQITKKENQIARQYEQLDEVNKTIAELNESLLYDFKTDDLTITPAEKAFKEKWGDANREDLDDEQLDAFIEDLFTLYETTGFADTIESSYSDQAEYNGMPFTVLRRATLDECDKETLPQWVVRVEDNAEQEEIFCFPEEICKIERQDLQSLCLTAVSFPFQCASLLERK